jgi:hypothetical protein
MVTFAVLAPVVALAVAVTAEDELELALVLDLLLEQPARPATTIAAPATPTKIPRLPTASPFLSWPVKTGGPSREVWGSPLEAACDWRKISLSVGRRATRVYLIRHADAAHTGRAIR